MSGHRSHYSSNALSTATLLGQNACEIGGVICTSGAFVAGDRGIGKKGPCLYAAGGPPLRGELFRAWPSSTHRMIDCS